nr:immunoglobulin light chain junction region [Macaca mulatta]MOW06371.1 immunoglobulin light chain junction region [Macaca mulatta]
AYYCSSYTGSNTYIF